MTKYSIVGALVAIGLAVSLTSAVADGPGAGYWLLIAYSVPTPPERTAPAHGPAGPSGKEG